MIFQFCFGVALAVLVINGACNMRSEVEKSPPQQVARTAATPSPETIPTGIFSDDEKAREAWEQFTANGRYRMARRDDFQIPESVAKEHQDNPYFTGPVAYAGGDFNRDGHGLDRAFIVMDTSTTANERFRLVVFNAPTTKESLPSVHWVHTAIDLSRSVLSAATEVVTLTEYNEDGSQQACNLRWDKKQAEYLCEMVR
jgi:hypothetical protein